MEKALLDVLLNNGVFALLFGYLLLYVLKQNQVREENYQKIIQNLNDVLPKIKDELENIREQLGG